MILMRTHYQDQVFKNTLITALQNIFESRETEPAFVCIGSDKHLDDCLGPLIGTMLSSAVPSLTVLGTLEEPIHAKNLVQRMAEVQVQTNNKIIIGIDAAVGREEDIGIIQLKEGSLLPGKALLKKLPPIGDYSLTAIVNSRIQASSHKREPRQGLGVVYQMAAQISHSIEEWYSKYMAR